MLYQPGGGDGEGATAIPQGWRLAHRPPERPDPGRSDTDAHPALAGPGRNAQGWGGGSGAAACSGCGKDGRVVRSACAVLQWGFAHQASPVQEFRLP